MPQKTWSKLSNDEKLDWLKVAIENVTEAANHNLQVRYTKERQLAVRLARVEEVLKKVVRAVQQIQARK
jgi:hypothetical protein